MMQNFSLQAHIGNDGLLHLNLPVAVKNTQVNVTVLCQSIPSLAVKQQGLSLWQSLLAFRANANLAALDIDTSLFDADRKHETERHIE